MHSRRLEDRIRELCARVVDADDEDFEPLINNLKASLREHTGRLREFAATNLTRLKTPQQKRSA